MRNETGAYEGAGVAMFYGEITTVDAIFLCSKSGANSIRTELAKAESFNHSRSMGSSASML